MRSPAVRRGNSLFYRGVRVCLVALAPLAATHASALDKQASAHGGDVAGAPDGFALSGSLLLGAALINPTYAARPDNSGHALLRFAPHLDIDLIGTRLSIPIDINLFSDRDRPGGAKLLPSEFDVISGLTSTWPLGHSALEIGARVEGDLPVDRGGLSQAYADVRARWLYSLASFFPDVRAALRGGDVSGSATLGAFAYNPTYAARPDNSGIALLRYGFHSMLQFTPRLFVAVDATLFTDRHRNAVRPSELDFTPELGATLIEGLDVHLAYERDMPVDQGHRVQQFLLLFFTWDFDLVRRPT
jgi:hypothetical protein